ncbi:MULTISPECIES: hypothetical protein [unclassified Streptomyces]|uniref:hypothetical protein n=1 Tax=unclassified Streptomyces TaxID=2593676 RepID=UPI0033DAF251
MRGADIGIYDRDVHHEHVVRPLVRALGEMGMPGLGPAGEQTGPRNGWAGTWSSCTPASRARYLRRRMNTRCPDRSQTIDQEVTT